MRYPNVESTTHIEPQFRSELNVCMLIFAKVRWPELQAVDGGILPGNGWVPLYCDDLDGPRSISLLAP